MSRVFNKRTAAATFAQAYDVLDTRSTSAPNELFECRFRAAGSGSMMEVRAEAGSSA